MAKTDRVALYPKNDSDPMQTFDDLGAVVALADGDMIDLSVQTDETAHDRNGETYGIEVRLSPAAARALAAQLLAVADRITGKLAQREPRA